jgi:hypothetical protein
VNRGAELDHRGDLGDASGLGIENLGDGLAALLASDDDLALAVLLLAKRRSRRFSLYFAGF